MAEQDFIPTPPPPLPIADGPAIPAGSGSRGGTPPADVATPGAGGGELAALREHVERLEAELRELRAFTKRIWPHVFRRTEGSGDVPDGTVFWVALTQTGGSNGSKTSAPSYSYTAVNTAGTTVGTGLTPSKRLITKGAVTAATNGFMRADGGTLTLVVALEEAHAS